MQSTQRHGDRSLQPDDVIAACGVGDLTCLVSIAALSHRSGSGRRQDIIGITKVPDVLQQWQDPECDWGDHTAWRLFNAATLVPNGKVPENPALTRKLHQVIDGVCERVAACHAALLR